jgi:hypothetical protein
VTKAAMKKRTCILVRPACRQQIASSAWAGRSGSFRPFRFRWFERRDFLLEPQQSGFGGDLIAPLTCRRVVAPAFQAAACPYFSGRYVTLRCRGDARDAYCIKLAAVSDVRMQCETLNHLMTTSASAPNRTSIGLYSSAISRGSLGDAIDGRSREGKFLRKCEAERVAQVGGLPSFAQRLLIRRVARAMLRLEAFDARMASGAWTDGDARTYGGLSNSLRLMLRELGFRSATERPRRLADVLNGAG